MSSDEQKTITLKWEPIQSVHSSGFGLPQLLRARVPGGWLVAGESMTSLAFVPDLRKDWVSEFEQNERRRITTLYKTPE